MQCSQREHIVHYADAISRHYTGSIRAVMKPSGRDERVQSLARGLGVIKAFGPERPKLTLSEVARETGLTRAAARRFLLTLQALNYVSSDGRYFRLEPRVLELGYAYLGSQPWWRSAQRVVERLAEEIDHPVAAGVIDEYAAVYLAHARPHRFAAFNRSVGTRVPVGSSAMGRVLLANLAEDEREARIARIELRPLTSSTVTDRRRLRAALSEVRRLGYALIDQELEVGLLSLAVPIKDRAGGVPAAIGMSASDPRLNTDLLVKRFLAPLRRAAAEIAGGLPA